MAYAIEYHVGRKYGSWKIGDKRFSTVKDAQQDIADLTGACIQVNATCIASRVVTTGNRP